ncbi:hypothetical protein ACXYTP_00160 [Tsukamurella ocularis]|uniref:hypothetical protein n=1 Tax=Tsukamurella ocularis TaxID=1970234 RepID=UPI0039F0169C
MTSDVAPGDDAAYHYVGTVNELPASHPDMYAVHENGDDLCVYRDGRWWRSPAALVREAMPWLVP